MKNPILITLFLITLFACKKKEEPQMVVDPPPLSEAELLADEQLRAYNNRDIEAFLVPYSDSVKVFYNLKDFGYQGKDKMRENYKDWFGSLNDLNCEIINRISSGDTVIDHEKVTFKRTNGQEGKMEAMAIYKINNGKIQEVYFTSPK
ncbi:MAG: nuclear transport factor 2 family protein [Bacteroidota bacterium]